MKTVYVVGSGSFIIGCFSSEKLAEKKLKDFRGSVFYRTQEKLFEGQPFFITKEEIDFFNY